MPRNVGQLCQDHNLTIEQLAAQSGLDAQRVTAIVMGRWTPSPQERRQIVDVFGVAVDDVAWGHATPVQHLYGHGPS